MISLVDIIMVANLKISINEPERIATTHRMMSGSTKNTPYPASSRLTKLTMVNRNLALKREAEDTKKHPESEAANTKAWFILH